MANVAAVVNQGGASKGSTYFVSNSTYEKTKRAFSKMLSATISWPAENPYSFGALVGMAGSFFNLSSPGGYRSAVSNALNFAHFFHSTSPTTSPNAGIDYFAQKILNFGLLSAPRKCLYDLSDALCTGETINVLSYISKNESLLYKYTNASFFEGEKATVCEILNTFPGCPGFRGIASETINALPQATDDEASSTVWYLLAIGMVVTLASLYFSNQKKRTERENEAAINYVIRSGREAILAQIKTMRRDPEQANQVHQGQPTREALDAMKSWKEQIDSEVN